MKEIRKINLKGSSDLFFNYNQLSDKIPENIYFYKGNMFFTYPPEKGYYKVNVRDVNNREFVPLNVNFSRSVVFEKGVIAKNCIDIEACSDSEFSYLNSNKVVKKYDIIKHRNDGGLNQDGIFIYDGENIIFMSYLQPDIFHFNNEGEYVGKFLTIDKNNIEQKVNKIGEAVYSFKNIPQIHQRGGSLDGDTLYILSGLRTKKDVEHKSEVLDIYSVGKGKYLGSIYLPLEFNQISDFKVSKNKMYILTYNNNLLIYEIKGKGI